MACSCAPLRAGHRRAAGAGGHGGRARRFGRGVRTAHRDRRRDRRAAERAGSSGGWPARGRRDLHRGGAIARHRATPPVPQECAGHARLDRTAAHPEPDDQRAVWHSAARATRRAGRRFSCAARRRRRPKRRAPRRIIGALARRAYRRPSTAPDLGRAAADLPGWPRRRRVRDAASNWRFSVILASPSSSSGSSATREPSPGRRVAARRSRAGLAAVVLPLEQHSRRRAARRRRHRQAARVRRAFERAGPPDARRPDGRARSSRTSPASGCSCGTCAACCRTRTRSRTSTTTSARRCVARPSCCSTASCARIAASRPAARRLHVRERAAGAPLRHPERLRQPVPPRGRDATRRAAGCSATAASSR